MSNLFPAYMLTVNTTTIICFYFQEGTSFLVNFWNLNLIHFFSIEMFMNKASAKQ